MDKELIEKFEKKFSKSFQYPSRRSLLEFLKKEGYVIVKKEDAMQNGGMLTPKELGLV